MTYEPGHSTVPPPRSRTRLLAVGAVVAVIAIAAAAFFLTRGSGSSDTPLDVAPQACVDALRKQLQDGIDAGANATEGTRPPECANVTDKGLEDAATALLEDALGGS